MTVWTPWPTVFSSSDLPWDDGIKWKSFPSIQPTRLPFDVEYVRRAVLRAADVTVEDDWIEALIAASTGAAQDATERALEPQTWQMVLSGLPASGRILIPRPPLIGVTSLVYRDADGVETDAGSPLPFEVVPSGHSTKGELRLPSGESWPTTAVRGDAVTITFECGYEDQRDPTYMLIKAGIALMIGELYKQRTLSVHAVHNTPSVLQVERFWKKVY